MDVALRPTRAARRMSLRVSGLDGRVTLSYPPGVRRRALDDFLDRHRDWLFKQAASAQAPGALAEGDAIPIEGQMRRIELGSSRSGMALTDAALIVPTGRTALGPRVQGILKTLARNALSADVDHYAAIAGRRAGRLTLRDTRSRWGSCSPAGDLMFSWRLIMAPADVRRYVAAHEVAHLTHMDHSPAFWAHIEHLMPGHAPHRSWLRANGKGLHRYRFD